jgi:hypothetical protein
MKCYAQFYYGPSYSSPMPDDYEVFDSLAEVRDALWRRADFDPRFPCVDIEQAEALVWLGTPPADCPYPCDGMPDRRVYFGPRGGVRIERC